MKNDKELLDVHMRIRREILPVMYKQIDIDNALEAKKNFFNKKKINAELARFYTQFFTIIQTQVWPSIYSSIDEYKLALGNIEKINSGKPSLPDMTSIGLLLEQLCYCLFSAVAYKKRYYIGDTDDKAHTEELYDYFTDKALDILETILNNYYKMK